MTLITCEICVGTGRQTPGGENKRCEQCNGLGKRLVVASSSGTGGAKVTSEEVKFQREQMKTQPYECSTCDGSGTESTTKKLCPTCGGPGQISPGKRQAFDQLDFDDDFDEDYTFDPKSYTPGWKPPPSS